MTDIKAIASYYGGEVVGGEARISSIGHSKRDRGTTIKPAPDAPDGVLVHSFNGDDLDEKDRLREDGFLPELGGAHRKTRPTPASQNTVRGFWITSDGTDLRNVTREELVRGPAKIDEPKLFVPAHTWDYYDEHGVFIYRKKRIDLGDGKKKFTFEQPNGKPGKGDAPHVLYRLPQLMEGEGDVYFAEGEKCADKLVHMGFEATSLKDLSKCDLAAISGRRCIILPDNDVAGDREAEKAETALTGHGCEALVIRLPGLPDKGDVVDWDGSAADLRSLVRSATDLRPVDLWAEQRPMELPQGILPEVIERFALENAKQTGTEAAGFAIAALVGCAGVIDDKICIKVRKHEKWTERACLWGLLYGDPSAKKSPIFRKVTSWHNQKNMAMQYENARKLSAWQEDGGNKSGEPKPKSRRMVLSNTSTEAALTIAADNPNGLCMFSDEIGGFFKRVESYGAGDSSPWLEAYNGGFQIIDRVNKAPLIAENFSVSMLGGIQPDKLEDLSGGMTDNGMLQRFIPVCLSAAGEGLVEYAPPVDEEYATLLERLHEVAHNKTENFFEQPVILSDDGYALREQFHKELTEEAELFYEFDKAFSNHLRKHEGMFPRLCLVWHCIESGPDGVGRMVPDHIPKRVAEFLGGFVRQHAQCFYARLSGKGPYSKATQDIGSWILSAERQTVSMRDARRSSKRFENLTPIEREDALGYLEAASWIIPKIGKRTDSKVWDVNPVVHKFYRKQADIEREKRKAITEKLNELRYKK